MLPILGVGVFVVMRKKGDGDGNGNGNGNGNSRFSKARSRTTSGYKNGNKTGSAKNALKAAGTGADVFARNEVREIKEKGVSVLKEAGKMAAELTAKGADTLIHKTGEGLEKAKPHLKKAQEDMSKKIEEVKEKKGK